jgi:hypothetical protein
MECPKCSGGSYLAEEELVKVLENTEPVKVITKAVFVCRACSERFSRLIVDTLDARKREDVVGTAGTASSGAASASGEQIDGLKFF